MAAPLGRARRLHRLGGAFVELPWRPYMALRPYAVKGALWLASCNVCGVLLLSRAYRAFIANVLGNDLQLPSPRGCSFGHMEVELVLYALSVFGNMRLRLLSAFFARCDVILLAVCVLHCWQAIFAHKYAHFVFLGTLRVAIGQVVLPHNSHIHVCVDPDSHFLFDDFLFKAVGVHNHMFSSD